jgi:hypothetical protein
VTRKTIGTTFILSSITAALVLSLATDLEAAPAAPRSMSSLMHLDHASDLWAVPAVDANAIVLEDLHLAPAWATVAPAPTIGRGTLDGEPGAVVSNDRLFRLDGLGRNDVFTFKFETPGTCKFLCSIDPQIMGTIVVK